MAITKKAKLDIMNQISGDANNTGLIENQIAILSVDIKNITDHVKVAKTDYSSKRGLYQKVSKRRSLLQYLKNIDIERYRAIVKKLDLRS
ncbi:MAG: 30S ribosomal protein S15 [Mycoplasmataceae bacterium]|jgi:small subunit ribosomal protein S15|nr:30S ribosomal protein S15 [Mycoplasmataceae bacterium]